MVGRSVLCLLAFASLGEALVVTPRAAPLVGSAKLRSTAPHFAPLVPAVARAATIQMAAEEGTEGKMVQGGFMGAGLLLVFGAAFCTSTGSPPTGLFVAFLSFVV